MDKKVIIFDGTDIKKCKSHKYKSSISIQNIEFIKL